MLHFIGHTSDADSLLPCSFQAHLARGPGSEEFSVPWFPLIMVSLTAGPNQVRTFKATAENVPTVLR